jgi:hypothetical protein
MVKKLLRVAAAEASLLAQAAALNDRFWPA